MRMSVAARNNLYLFFSMDSAESPPEDRKNDQLIQPLWDGLFGFEELFQMISSQMDIHDESVLQIISLLAQANQLLQASSEPLPSPLTIKDIIGRVEAIFCSLRSLLSQYYPPVQTISNGDLISLGIRSREKMNQVIRQLSEGLPQDTAAGVLEIHFDDVLRTVQGVEKLLRN